MSTLYVLQLEDGKYYVGRTDDVTKRYAEHKSGRGSEWTKLHKPVKMLETHESKSAEDETNLTKFLMKKFGVDNVRGGAYCQRELPDYVEDMIEHEARSSSDKCYKCGKSGHFAKNCRGRSSFTGNCECGKEFLDVEEFMSHIKGCRIRNKVAEKTFNCDHCNREYQTESQSQSCQCKFAKIARMAGRAKLNQKSSSSGVTCYRCGRPGHYSTQCYARSTVDGDDLDSDDDDYQYW